LPEDFYKELLAENLDSSKNFLPFLDYHKIPKAHSGRSPSSLTTENANDGKLGDKRKESTEGPKSYNWRDSLKGLNEQLDHQSQ